MENEFTVGSLFSGVGGIEIGFEKQGFKTRWFVEKQPYAQEILKKRFPNTQVYEDITTIDFTAIPKIDILTGGFPCQDISNAGKGVGITGSRSSLWKYYAEAIRILRPKFALIENVSALTIRGLNTVLSDLAKIGYDAEWYNLSASSVGANHRRERIFIICYPHNNGLSSSKKRESTMEGSNTGSEKQNKARESSGSSEQSRDMGRLPKEELQELSNPYSSGRMERQVEKFSTERREYAFSESESSCKDVSYTECVRPSEQRQPRRPLHKEENSEGEASRFNDDSIWRAEPELGRVADGIPNRVDRIKCLGNAVVPQCAEVFAQAIKMKLMENQNV